MKKVLNYINEQFLQYEDNSEVSELKEEIIQNCQQRFDENINHGMTQDEAEEEIISHIGNLSEALDIIAIKADQSPAEKFYSKSNTSINMINVITSNADVKFIKSLNDNIEIFATNKIHRSVDNGCLVIKQLKVDENLTALHKIFSNKYDPNLQIQIALPDDFEVVKVKSHSGEISFEDASIHQLTVKNTSGDIKGKINQLNTSQLNCVSGKIQAMINGSEAEIITSTVSGNLDIAITSANLIDLSSVSGNSAFTPLTNFHKCNIQTVSGDIYPTTKDIQAGLLKIDTKSGNLIGSSNIKYSANENIMTIKSVSGDFKFK